MLRMYRRMGPLLCGLFALMLLVGCAENERRKVTVTEEQHEGEVREVSPGEMVVE
ncbi:MAG: hypothetical protein KAY37_05240 [Phycisphaerae bacterium]|nr:hypothetical protein [Phycisphaerae bacterium]